MKTNNFKIEILSEELNENYKHDIIETIETTDKSEMQKTIYNAFDNDLGVNLYVNGICKNSSISRYL